MLASNISAGSVALQTYASRFAAATNMAMAQAQTLATASAYNELLRQATMLAYKNAFAILAWTVMALSPLVWLMRLPPKRVKVDPEQMAAH